MIQTYLIIAVLLLAAELIYFHIADKFNIFDKNVSLTSLLDMHSPC